MIATFRPVPRGETKGTAAAASRQIDAGMRGHQALGPPRP